ncbi:MAG TPA: hypothetical protein PKN54_10075 [Candidatus Cloacimonas acidaminovorans]|nr:hypothetical protein [Candidatus Cloacimonas acidaminovorans]
MGNYYFDIWGSKMIKFTVQFWTNNLPKGTNNRTAWGAGAIHIVANKSRGVKHDHVFFNELNEFMPKFQELMDKHEIKLITRPEKYVEVKLSK